MSLRFSTSEVTLSGFAGGEYLPLPTSKGLAFPFLLTLDGYPTSPANFAHGQRCSLETQETPHNPYYSKKIRDFCQEIQLGFLKKSLFAAQEDFFDHSKVRFTANLKLALRAQTLDLRAFRLTKNDGFVKSPSAALRCILRHCSVLLCTPHSSGFARLASGSFFFAV